MGNAQIRTSDLLLQLLDQSENGALTDLAIREQMRTGMHAVPSLRTAGMISTAVETCWIEPDGGGPAVQRECTVVRLTRRGRLRARGIGYYRHARACVDEEGRLECVCGYSDTLY
jgi:hypothetical protein